MWTAACLDGNLDMGDHIMIMPEKHDRQNLLSMQSLFCFASFLDGIFASYTVACAQPWSLVAAILQVLH